MDKNKILTDFHARRQLFDNYLKTTRLDKFTCPSCGFPTLDERSGYEICAVCNWEDDGQDDHNADEVLGGPNYELSLTASRLKIGEELETLASKLNGQIISNPEKVFVLLHKHSSKMDSVINKMTGHETLDHPLWNEYRETEQSVKVDLIEPKK